MRGICGNVYALKTILCDMHGICGTAVPSGQSRDSPQCPYYKRKSLTIERNRLL